MARLSAADVDDLPVIVRFLLQSIAMETVADVRVFMINDREFRELMLTQIIPTDSGNIANTRTIGFQNARAALKCYVSAAWTIPTSRDVRDKKSSKCPKGIRSHDFG